MAAGQRHVAQRDPWLTAWLLGGLLLGLPPWSTSRAADPEIEYHADLVYGQTGGVELKLDLARPQGLTSPRPALLAIHGGAWAAGSKNDFRDLARGAARQGFVAVTISYRLAPQHLFPAQIEDCKCAVRWLRAHAGQWQIDPARIGAMGGSAGGHLAMMLGAMDAEHGLEGDGGWAEHSSKVQAVVSFVGPTNLVGEFGPVSQGLLKNFLGGTPAEKGDAYRLASPVRYVGKGDAPMLLFQGTKDPLVPYDQAFQMASALSEAGVPGRVEILLGEGHGFGPREMERSLAAMYAFFRERLKP
jgi:acetyl esterase/lipase